MRWRVIASSSMWGWRLNRCVQQASVAWMPTGRVWFYKHWLVVHHEERWRGFIPERVWQLLKTGLVGLQLKDTKKKPSVAAQQGREKIQPSEFWSRRAFLQTHHLFVISYHLDRLQRCIQVQRRMKKLGCSQCSTIIFQTVSCVLECAPDRHFLNHSQYTFMRSSCPRPPP